MQRRKSSAYFLLVATLLALCGLMLAHTSVARHEAQSSLDEKRRMVQSLALTDLCLFTEARYTRHPAVADIHSAFQDGPMSLEHFPSGSLLGPVSLKKPLKE